MAKIRHDQFPLNDVLHVFDGEGTFWQNLIYIDTDTGEIAMLRLDQNGQPIPIANPPKGVPNSALLVTHVKVPTPITLVFADLPTKEHLKQTGQRPRNIIDHLFSSSYKYEPAIHDKEKPTPQFTCPCCSAEMTEQYSTLKKWYLKCTECSAQLIK